MCGIFAYLNFFTPKKRSEVIDILLQGLRRMEYRGYDSAGYKQLFLRPFASCMFECIFLKASPLTPVTMQSTRTSMWRCFASLARWMYSMSTFTVLFLSVFTKNLHIPNFADAKELDMDLSYSSNFLNLDFSFVLCPFFKN